MSLLLLHHKNERGVTQLWHRQSFLILQFLFWNWLYVGTAGKCAVARWSRQYIPIFSRNWNLVEEYDCFVVNAFAKVCGLHNASTSFYDLSKRDLFVYHGISTCHKRWYWNCNTTKPKEKNILSICQNDSLWCHPEVFKRDQKVYSNFRTIAYLKFKAI